MVFELMVKFKEPLYGRRGWYKVSEHATKAAAELKMDRLYDSIVHLTSCIVAWKIDAVDLEDASNRCTIHEESNECPGRCRDHSEV